MKRDLPKRVYERHGAWYFVDMAGKWHRLCAVRQGMPAMYRALADLTEHETQSDRMPAVISRWYEGKRIEWAPATQRNMERIASYMSRELAEFTPAELKPPRCNAYLSEFAHMPHTYTQHRTMLRMVLSFAALEGLRDGHNPVDDVPAKSAPPRRRIVTDAEIEAIKRAAEALGASCAGLAPMIDLALITGQRIGDLIGLRWEDVTTEGLLIVQGKTGERLLIEWSPALRAAIDTCAAGRERIGHVLINGLGKGWGYAGIYKQWAIACRAAGVDDMHIHDLRGRAGVDALLAAGEDVRAAQRLLGHRGEGMTRRYVEGKYAKRVKPSR